MSAVFEQRCPFCRRRFSAASPFEVSEMIIAHVTEKHVSSEDAIRWDDPRLDPR